MRNRALAREAAAAEKDEEAVSRGPTPVEMNVVSSATTTPEMPAVSLELPAATDAQSQPSSPDMPQRQDTTTASATAHEQLTGVYGIMPFLFPAAAGIIGSVTVLLVKARCVDRNTCD